MLTPAARSSESFSTELVFGPDGRNRYPARQRQMTSKHTDGRNNTRLGSRVSTDDERDTGWLGRTLRKNLVSSLGTVALVGESDENHSRREVTLLSEVRDMVEAN